MIQLCKPRRAEDGVQSGSARNSWLCVQRTVARHGEELAKVSHLEPQGAPRPSRRHFPNPPALLLSRSSTGGPGTSSRATNSGFSLSRTTLLPILSSPKAGPAQSGAGESAPISHAGGADRLLPTLFSSCIARGTPNSCPIAMSLPVPRAAMAPAELLSSSSSHTLLQLGTGALGTLWLVSPGAERLEACPPQLSSPPQLPVACGAGLRG